MTRDDMISHLYKFVRMHAPISRTAYGNSLYGWQLDPVVIDGEFLGVRLLNGHEIHIQLDRKKILHYARRVIRWYIAEPLRHKGFLTTRAKDGDLPFLLRIGFYVVDRTDGLITLRLDKLKIK